MMRSMLPMLSMAVTAAAASSCSSVDISSSFDDFLSGAFYPVGGSYFERSGEDPSSTSGGASYVTRLVHFDTSSSSGRRRLEAVRQEEVAGRRALLKSSSTPSPAPASGSVSDRSFDTDAPTSAPTPAPFDDDVACESGIWAITRYSSAKDAYYYPLLGAQLTSDDCQGASSVIDALAAASWRYYDGSDVTTSSSSSSGTEATVSLDCVGASSGEFSITLINVEGDDTYSQYFEEAAARWMEVIVGDLPDYDAGVVDDLFDGAFADIGVTYSGAVDDIVIGYRVTATGFDGTGDGAFNTLAHAAPTGIRANIEGSSSSSNADWTSVAGFMEVDAADVEQMIADGILVETILHEMGHVFGIGSTWQEAGCTQCVAGSSSPTSTDTSSSSIVGSPDYDPAGVCPSAGEAFATISSDTLLVENRGGPGTACSHFDELQLDNELMTGISEAAAGATSLSVISIAALEDLGYEVDYNAADAYTLPSTSSRRATEDIAAATEAPAKKLRFDLRNDVLPITPMRLGGLGNGRGGRHSR